MNSCPGRLISGTCVSSGRPNMPKPPDVIHENGFVTTTFSASGATSPRDARSLAFLANFMVGDFMAIDQRRFADRKVVFGGQRRKVELARIGDVAGLAYILHVEISPIRLAILLDRRDDFGLGLFARVLGNRLGQS